MQKKTVSKKSEKELLAIITKSQNRYQRIWLAGATLIFSVLALFVAWWFWQTIIQSDSRPRFDFIGHAAVITLAISSYLGIVSAALIVARKPVVARLFSGVVTASLISSGVIVISTVVEVRGSNFDWLQSLGQAFRDFTMLDIGSLSISIPMVITVVIIVCIITTDMLKKNK